MERTFVDWLATVLSAKLLADAVRRRYGFDMPNAIASSRTAIEVDPAYFIGLAVCLAIVLVSDLQTALLMALLVNAANIAGVRVVSTANHQWLELFVTILFLRLRGRPDTLLSALQLITLSVWVYSAWQKVYHGKFVDGTFFYLVLQNPAALQDRLLRRFVPQFPPLQGYFGPVDPVGGRFCRRLAVMVVAAECGVPLIAFALNGTIWSVALLLTVVLPVGMLVGETNFMISNLLLSLTFIAPFDLDAFLAVRTDPLAAAIVGWCLVWPPLHAALTRHFRLSSWKMAGWGMYAVPGPGIFTVGEQGELVRARSGPRAPYLVLSVWGASTVRWIRDYAARGFYRWCHKGPSRGLVFRWHRRRGNHYVTEAVWIPNTPGAVPQVFVIDDAGSQEAFEARLIESVVETPVPAASQPVPVVLTEASAER